MNYEEKYKQALERARKLYNEARANDYVSDMEDYEHIFPELREYEDERIRKEIIELVHFFYGSSTIYEHHVPEANMIAWLEKQGEHANFRNKIQVGDKVTRNEDGVLVNLSQLKRVAKSSEKSADKNESKFKIGDWITNGEYTWKVTDIKSLDYILQSPNGDVVDDTISYVDEELRLWTIEDAKDGDVLANKYGAIFINAGSNGGVTLDCYCYLSVQNKFCIEEHKTGSWLYKNNIKPATKEQRDLLFQKMHEAGYEWDVEKKELWKQLKEKEEK